MAVDKTSYFKYLVAEDLALESLTSGKLLDRIETLEKAHIGESTLESADTVSKINKRIVHSKNRDSKNKCKHCGYPGIPIMNLLVDLKILPVGVAMLRVTWRRYVLSLLIITGLLIIVIIQKIETRLN